MLKNWPTANDVLWLIAGLLPLVWIVLRAVRYGRRELVSLGAFGVMTIWVGYHLKPWLGLSTGGWSSFLLHEEYVTEGIRYSALAMFAYITGFTGLAPTSKARFNPTVALPKADPRLVLWLTLVSVIVATAAVGGPGELWSATRYRGEGQFEEKDLAAKLQNILAIASTFLAFVTAGMGALLLAQSRSLLRSHVWIIGVTAILLGSLHPMWKFSRGAGFGFALFAVVQALYWRSSRVPVIIVSLVIAGWLSWTGYTQRGAYGPGVANFLVALFDPQPVGKIGASRRQGWIDPNVHFLDALDPWTARAWTRERTQPTFREGLLGTMAILQPVPSQFVPFSARAGESLSRWMGTWGSTGLTTPALGEIYYLLGYYGLLVVAGIGAFIGWAQRRFVCNPWNGENIILYFSVILGLVIGLHSGLRAMTRPMLYGWVTVVVFILFPRPRRPDRNLRRKHPRHARTADRRTVATAAPALLPRRIEDPVAKRFASRRRC